MVMIAQRIAIAILVIATCTHCSLDSFLFNPEPLTQYQLSNAIIPDSLREEITFRSDDETLYGFFVRQRDSLRVAPHPTVIYHHGNKDNLGHYWDRVELLYEAGFDVFIYDYRGFGRSTGKSSEAGMQQDAAAALDYVLSRRSTDTTMITHYGYSLGGYPALYSAAFLRGAHAVILEAAFASGEALVQSGTLLNVPGSYFLDGAYNNEILAQKRTCPLLLIHGTEDAFISVEKSGQRLFDVARSPKTFIRVPGAGHSNVPSTMGTETYKTLITAFVRGN